MKKYKNNKGITLIALIVTVIVLLVISGIVISKSFNKGLVDQAKNTRNEIINFKNSTSNSEKSFTDLIGSSEED